MLKQGDLFEMDGKKFLALSDAWVQFVQDFDARNYSYDYGSAYRFVNAQPVEPAGVAVRIKFDGQRVSIISKAAC